VDDVEIVHVVGARMSLMRMHDGLKLPPVSVQPKAIT
jgi:hypothetical protein